MTSIRDIDSRTELRRIIESLSQRNAGLIAENNTLKADVAKMTKSKKHSRQRIEELEEAVVRLKQMTSQLLRKLEDTKLALRGKERDVVVLKENVGEWAEYAKQGWNSASLRAYIVGERR